MALGDGTGWNTADPNDSDILKDGDDEIRDVRLGTGIRVDKEHETLATASAGGEHKEGSAKAYYEASAPTNTVYMATPPKVAQAA